MQQLNPDARMRTMTKRPQSAQSQNDKDDGIGGDGIGEDLDENLLTPDEEESLTVISHFTEGQFWHFLTILQNQGQNS